MLQYCSTEILKLPPLSSSTEDKVVRDGPKKGTNQKLPITPENYQSEAERIKLFFECLLNETIHPEQLACNGFVYTGKGTLV